MLEWKTILTFCVALLFLQLGGAQSNAVIQSDLLLESVSKPRIKHFTLQDGMSQVSTNDLIRDHNGIVWIATQDGLNRFDGNEFVHYKHDAKDSTSVSGNLINKLLEDQKGRLWVGTIGNGLNYYNSKNDVFHRVSLDNSTSSSEIITALSEDQMGTIWVGSRLSGLHQLQHKDNGPLEQFHFLSDIAIGALQADADQNLWVGGSQGDLYKILLNNNRSIAPVKIASDLGNIQSLYNTNTHLLIGSDIGFFMLDHKTGQVELVELEDSGEFKTRHVLDFLEHGHNAVWIASGNGMYLFDWNLKTVKQSLHNSEDNRGLSNNTVQALLSISNDRVLAGTANYLNLVDFGQPFFSTISKNKKGQHLLNDNVIFSVFKDEHGLWIGTSDGGLNLIKDDIVYHITEDENLPTSIAGGVVRAIVKDEENQRLWIGTTRGLSLLNLKEFNPNNPRFTAFNFNPDDENSINSDFIKDIVLDQNNAVWGATYGEGFFKLEFNLDGTTHITRYKHEANNPNSLINNFGQCIRVDENNDIWVGTQGGCSHIVESDQEGNSPIFNNYYRNPNLKDPLSHNSVYDILLDNNGQIWFGTRHGLNLFLGNNEFKSWIEQDQLPNAVIYSIQNDKENNLWLGTNDGLVRYDSKLEEFAQFTEDDGIQSSEFDIHTRYKDDDGIIYMGGIAGLSYFDPSQLSNIDQATPLYFSNLRVKSNENKKLDNTTHQVLDPKAGSMDLEFNYNQFPFYLEFSSIDFRLQKNVVYAYKLLPNDEVWNRLNDTKIQFLNLEPGEYQLQVNGFSRGKEWRQKPLEMNLTIQPPWWLTWWAYLLYLGAIGFSGILFYRFSLSKKLAVAESVKLKELDVLKDHFYANITHEFRTPLTVISGMADELDSNLKKDPQKKINLIKRTARIYCLW